MNDETVTDALLREFLLGKVTDEVRERIEGLFVTDAQARERILAVEQDLIEDYLEETLSADDRERFVSRYAQTAEQRRKLRITKSIKEWAMTSAAATPMPAATPAVPVAASRRSHQRSWFRPAFVVPVAVMVLLVILVAAFWAGRRSQQAAIERDLAQLNAPSNTTPANVERELLPVTVRGAGSQVQLSPPPEDLVIELRLVLIQKERYPRYTATIHRLDDRASYTVPNLSPTGDGKSVHLRLHSQLLTRGVWQITLTPDNAPASSDEYQLTVGS